MTAKKVWKSDRLLVLVDEEPFLVEAERFKYTGEAAERFGRPAPVEIRRNKRKHWAIGPSLERACRRVKAEASSVIQALLKRFEGHVYSISPGRPDPRSGCPDEGRSKDGWRSRL